MSALTYTEIADLCDQRLGMRDVACPLCGPSRHAPENRRRRVLRIWHQRPGFASFACARCGERGYAHEGERRSYFKDTEAIDRLRREAERRDQDYAALQLQKAKWLWQHRQPIAGSLAETYLREVRAYGGALPATLGFLPPQKKRPHPAMVAAFGVPDEPEPGKLVIAEHQVKGVHLTLLALDGRGKAGVERSKLFVGSSSGWPIVIAPPNDLLGMVVTEGIEDALSAHQATGLAAWAAGSAGRMPALAERIPSYIDCITVCADDDADGQRHAYTLADALTGRGFEVLLENVK
jgi:hypothetical protein